MFKKFLYRKSRFSDPHCKWQRLKVNKCSLPDLEDWHTEYNLTKSNWFLDVSTIHPHLCKSWKKVLEQRDQNKIVNIWKTGMPRGRFYKAKMPKFVFWNAKIFRAFSMFNFIKALTPKFSQNNTKQWWLFQISIS